MGSYRSKEDDVSKISMSIFVMNFPDSFSAKDLFHSCKQYGVVDTFIPLKRSKDDRLKFHANIARFQRTPLNGHKTQENKETKINKSGKNVPREEGGVTKSGKSFVHVLKGNNMSGNTKSESIPAIVLDDECLYTKDLSKSLMGRVKEFVSLSNLKKALTNEGFVDINIWYMGELWVMLEFATSKSRDLFRENVGAGSWFSVLHQASTEFSTYGRIVWVEIEGVLFKLWSGNTFKRIASKWGDLLDVDDQEETCFHSKRLCLYTKLCSNIFESFKIVFCGMMFWIRAKEVPGWVPEFMEDSDDEVQSEKGIYGRGSCSSGCGPDNVTEEDNSLKYPLGFTPNSKTKELSMNEETVYGVNVDREQNCNSDEIHNGQEGNSANKDSKDSTSDSVCSGQFKIYMAPSTGGSILCLMEELVKVGQTIGLAQKAKKDWVKELCVKNKVTVLALQETKMKSMELFCVKSCWGNYAFDFVHSDSVGNSGGILCAWDPNSFRSSSSTISDYFVMIRGVWLKTGVNLLIVVVYAPRDLRDKRMLWEYLANATNQWDGEVVMMGDFNKVRHKSDRFGSVFNAQGTNVFNSFIVNAGLEEVPLGVSAYTWCHKSASKMSKLDRFLISENLMNFSPNISAITLDRYLSDHRPILLRESTFDYGLNVAPGDGSNGSRRGTYVAIDNGKGSEEVIIKRMEVVNSIQRVNKIHATEIAQKAKIKWSVEGDENSRFFHGMLNKKRSQLSIRGIMADGVWIEKPDQVKGDFFQHFSSRFGKLMQRRANVDMCYPNSLTIEQQEDLELIVSKEELKRAVWDCGVDKSPGPDGFTFGFYRQFWSTIEKDVFEAVNHFITYGDIPNGCNSSFIALILEVSDANMVKDFRPISLIGSIYKIIAKILANRLVGVLGDIVNEVQSAFIVERQILDGPFIINEVMQWCSSKKKQAVIFKVDFEKAYDSVRWDFLDDVLTKFGFGNKWRVWIQSCLRSSRGSIIINGSPTEEFQFFKGLKQGDPLAHFLFILIMESLHLSFQRVVDADMFTGIKLSPSLNLSHMFYADDVVFVGQWCDGVYVEDMKVKHAASKLGCLILNTPFTYLGTKVGGAMSRVNAWKEIVDKVKTRLSKWKMKTLSIGGRLTLLKSVLGSLPIFHMSIHRVPKRVLHTLESIQSHFFNGHDLSSRKATWVKWSNVLAAKEKGGLGVSSLYALNRGLMLKWVWRFYSQKTSLWARVVKAIHGEDGSVGKEIKAGAQSCWVNIVNEVNVLKEQGVNFFKYMRLKLGNGVMTSFWEDNWINGCVFKYMFPRVYALETSKLASVSTKLMDSSLENSLRRKIRGGVEQSQYNALFELVDEVNLVPQSDRYVWSLDSSGEFSVASIRKVIDDNRSPNINTMTRWVKYVPIKVNVFAWKVKMDALPTRLNISHRGIDIESILCPICESGAESSRHLFFNCNLVRQISRKIALWWDVSHVDVNSIVEWLNWLVSLRLTAKLKAMLEGLDVKPRSVGTPG
ncbi:RNA-directed DNA polymerase, eukaryota [Tanacetum coccineum]|uniref:RNA-directed DNA polymerase, eukaryota n=1 Tax=Tanacetum coccineum TaxID=301880 RepID=A0ABQ5DFX1_9ASTR